MDESIGRTSEPTTPPTPANPTAGPAAAPESAARRGVRDVLPPVEYEGTVLSDPTAGNRSVDPLDPHAPSRETNDPLDPDGHVI